MVKEKSTGLKFAEEQLLRHGWEKGEFRRHLGLLWLYPVL